MRPRTVAALAAVLGALGGALIVGLADVGGTDADLAERWTSETGADVGGNHHAVAAGRVRGTGLVFAPISAPGTADGCALYALDAADGTVAWHHPIPTPNCTVHAVADPTIADHDGDGSASVFAATTEREVAARHPLTGAVQFRHRLSSYGYSRPVVANLTGDRRPEVVVVDVSGMVHVLRGDGRLVWSRTLGGHAWGQPAVADFDRDGGPELVVGLGGTGGLHRLESDGSAGWSTPPAFGGSITWLATGEADDDAAREVVVGTAGGTVAVVDGDAGTVQWRRNLGRLAAVHALADGDGDGTPEVYAVAADGVLRSLDARDGSVEWTTRLARSPDVQMMPPPALGDVTGDGQPDLIAPANDGTVTWVDPESGAVRAIYRRDDRIFARPTLADADADGVAEAYVVYADGTVAALEARR